MHLWNPASADLKQKCCRMEYLKRLKMPVQKYLNISKCIIIPNDYIHLLIIKVLILLKRNIRNDVYLKSTNMRRCFIPKNRLMKGVSNPFHQSTNKAAPHYPKNQFLFINLKEFCVRQIRTTSIYSDSLLYF